MSCNKTTEGRLMRRRKLLGIKARITICGERKQLDLKDKTRMFFASTAFT